MYPNYELNFWLILNSTFILRWWKRIGLAEDLSFFRDRPVENYVWAMGMNFHPNLANLREVTTMVINFITNIDDIYDVYGTLEELELFTKAIDRLRLLFFHPLSLSISLPLSLYPLIPPFWIFLTFNQWLLVFFCDCSWDLKAMDSLPHYMKICFLALYNFVNDVAFIGLKQNGYNIVPYLKKAVRDYLFLFCLFFNYIFF